MILAIGEACRFTYTIIVNAVIGDIGLICKGRPCAEYKRVLLHRFHWLGHIDRHETLAHLGVGLRFGIVHFSTKVTQIFSQQLTATNTSTIIV